MSAGPLVIAFLLRSTLDLLPTPVNCKQWGKDRTTAAKRAMLSDEPFVMCCQAAHNLYKCTPGVTTKYSPSSLNSPRRSVRQRIKTPATSRETRHLLPARRPDTCFQQGALHPPWWRKPYPEDPERTPDESARRSQRLAGCCRPGYCFPSSIPHSPEEPADRHYGVVRHNEKRLAHRADCTSKKTLRKRLNGN
jgi:hypothetical protein